MINTSKDSLPPADDLQKLLKEFIGSKDFKASEDVIIEIMTDALKHREEIQLPIFSMRRRLKSLQIKISDEKKRKIYQIYNKIQFGRACKEDQIAADKIIEDEFSNKHEKSNIIANQLQHAFDVLDEITLKKDRNKEVMQSCIDLFKKASLTKDQIKKIKSIIKSIDKKEKAEVVRLTSILRKGISQGNEIITLMETIKDIPQHLREEAVKDVLPLCEQYADGLSRMKWIKSLVQIPHHERADLIKCLAPIFEGNKDALLIPIGSIIEILRNIRQDQRDEVIKLAQSLFKGIPSPSERALLVRSVGQLSPEKRAEICKWANLLCEGISSANERSKIIDKITKIIDVLRDIPPDQRSLTFEEVIPFLKDKNFNERIQIIENLSLFPTPSVKELMGITQQLFNDIPLLKTEFYQIFRVFPSEDRPHILELLRTKKELFLEATDTNTFLSLIFKNQQEGLQARSLSFLNEELEHFMSDSQKALSISTLIIQRASGLLLEQEDPLLQLCLLVQDAANPNYLQNKKNPYRLYSELKKKQLEPFIPFDTKPEKMTNGIVWVNLEALRKKERVVITFENSPKGIEKNSLEKTIKGFEKRLNDLSQAEQKEVLDYIQNSFGKSYLELKNNITEPISVISNYLNFKGSKKDPISLNQLYFYRILHFLLNASQERGDKEDVKKPLLTEQEEILFSMSSSITYCATGQKDGIDRYYQNIAKSMGQKWEGTDTSKMVKFHVDEIINHAVNEIFDNSKFLSDLVGEKEVDQEAHQTLYLKNSFGKQVGLSDHEVVFDLYTHVINDILIDKKPEEVMKFFFSYLPSEKLIKDLKTRFKQLMETGQIKEGKQEVTAKPTLTFGTLSQYLESILPEDKRKASDWFRDYIELDDDDMPIGITDLAAQEILIHENYISRHVEKT